MGSQKFKPEDLQDQIYSLSMKCCRILFISVDMMDPGRKSISKKYLSELKGEAQELQKEADKLP